MWISLANSPFNVDFISQFPHGFHSYFIIECVDQVGFFTTMVNPHIFLAISMILRDASQAMTSRGPQWIRGSCQGFYHYADTTCDFSCLLTEGFYWSLTSLLGGQDACECHARKDHYRCCSISDEWRPCTSHEMRRGRNDLGGSPGPGSGSTVSPVLK